VSWRHPPNHPACVGIFPGNNEQLTTPDRALASLANSRAARGRRRQRVLRVRSSPPHGRGLPATALCRDCGVIHLLLLFSHTSRSRTAHRDLCSTHSAVRRVVFLSGEGARSGSARHRTPRGRPPLASSRRSRRAGAASKQPRRTPAMATSRPITTRQGSGKWPLANQERSGEPQDTGRGRYQQLRRAYKYRGSPPVLCTAHHSARTQSWSVDKQ
jgi:hypothetical protein